MLPARRVHWFRSSAQFRRWKEELEILEEEMKRTVRFFMYWERKWLDIARSRDAEGEDGAAAYARR